MIRSVLRTVAVLSTAAFLAAPAKGQSVIRAVRRGDRGGLIIKLDKVLPKPVGYVQHVIHGSLVDLTHPAPIPIDTLSDISATGCPALNRVANQLCIDLSGGATLDDGHRYLLAIDSIPVSGKPALLVGQTVMIETVRGHVVPPSTHPVESVVVTYDVDLATDNTLALVLHFGKGRERRPVSITATRVPREPLCYKQGEFEFNCRVSTSLAHGDSVFAEFTRLDGDQRAVPSGTIMPAADTVSGIVKDTVINIKGGYAQTTAARSATISALWQNMALPGTRTQLANHDYTISFDGSLSPYVNLLWTTDKKTADYVNIGVQYAGYLSSDSPLRVVGLFVTPRTETDTKATVANFMYLDAEIRPGIRYLYAGPVFLGGHYSITPHGGVELGHTIKGTTGARLESNNPSRWKAGVTAVLAWPAVESKTGLCAWIGCGGVSLSADWQHYILNDVPPSVTVNHHDWGTVSGTYKFTAHVGLSVTYQNGAPPPLFAYQRVVQVGIALVY